jgi:hypothetical protein
MKTRKLLFVSWLVAAFALMHSAWVLISRRMSESDSAKVEGARLARSYGGLPAYSGTELKILAFYTGSAVVTRGDPLTLCYGVINARSVQIEPGVDGAGPSLNRCVSASPKETTTYTLTARSANGEEAKQSFTVEVRPPEPFIVMFAASAKKVPRGDRYAICYEVKNATAVRIEPLEQPLRGSKDCVLLYPRANMNFRLVAHGESGKVVTEKLAVKVY